MTIEDTIIELINSLKDPFMELNGKEMNLQYQITNTEHDIHINLFAGYPIAWLERSYKPILMEAIKNQYPGYQITLSLQPFIKAHKTQMVGQALRGVKNTIAVASGKGGVGKSTVAVNLAAALAKLGARVCLLDADIYGPSIPIMLGQTKPPQIVDNYYIPTEVHGLQAMSIGYLTDNHQALIWRGPMLAKSFIQMLDRTHWNELDYLLIDLPPGTGDIQLTLVQKIPLTSAIIVTTPQNVATLDAQKAITMFSRTGIDILGVIENMSTHLCSQCGHEEAIFGEGGASTLCHDYQCQLLGQLPLDKHVRKDCDKGVPTATHSSNPLTDIFIKTALKTAIELSKKPINYANKFPKIVLEPKSRS